MSLLDKKLEPKDGDVFKFVNPEDRIYAEFVGRRVVKTKQQDAARVFDCVIIESRIAENGRDDEGPTGPHTVFESTHVTELLDRHQLKLGECFILQLCSIDRKSRFKKFALEKQAPKFGFPGEDDEIDRFAQDADEDVEVRHG